MNECVKTLSWKRKKFDQTISENHLCNVNLKPQQWNTEISIAAFGEKFCKRFRHLNDEKFFF